MKILFLGKDGDAHCERALAFVRKNFDDTAAHLGKWGDPLPDGINLWEGDYIISYLSRWIVPARLIEKARKAAVNFHPASPDYPGIGCNNFALYEGAEEYGVTCHYMDKAVDTGDIIAVKRFPIFRSDDVASLLSRTYDFQLALFYEIMGGIIDGKELPSSSEAWTRRPFLRTQFNELFNITPDMDDAEINRRVRATDYMDFKPVVKFGGYTFELKRL